jgi:hypothetical protein
MSQFYFSNQSGGGGTIDTITGNTGGPQPPTAGNFNFLTANSTVLFAGAASTETLDFGISNLLLGSSGTTITSAGSNTGLGSLILQHLTSGNSNTAIGEGSLNVLTTGSQNTAVGVGSLTANVSSTSNVAIGVNSLATLASGSGVNTAIGTQSLGDLSTGTNNIAVGDLSGNSYTGAESSNICIGNTGTLGESNVIRLGTQGSSAGQQNECFIAGIVGVTASNAEFVTINSSTGQLGVQTGGVIMAWTDEGTSFNAIAGNGYFSTAAVTATLPASPAQGNMISFIVDSANALTITANTGQKIRLGTTISAAAGTCVSNAQGNSITLIYRSSDTTWLGLSSVGTWTIT